MHNVNLKRIPSILESEMNAFVIKSLTYEWMCEVERNNKWVCVCLRELYKTAFTDKEIMAEWSFAFFYINVAPVEGGRLSVDNN